MKGYLMQELDFHKGQDLFIESASPENRYAVVFEDDGETGYFYAVEKDAQGDGMRILDALHIYEVEEDEPADTAGTESSRMLIIWSRDWLKCALVIDAHCHAVFDFEAHGGYNINEFPPPNESWTEGTRTLTDELVRQFF